jgi:NAD(P)-dependent dehydrogenase (short-subunit alcohol dehydrogenase family)
MARIFITGSSDGLGQLAARALVTMNHQVVLHARNEKRGQEALNKVPGAEGVLTGDLNNMEETISLAHKVNQLGRFDAVIHNAGVYNASAKEIFNVNVLAPYILTCLIQKPERLIYISSGMHLHGHAGLNKLNAGINGISYSDSKLYVLMFCLAVARKWPEVYANAVDPGWVPTKMGGRGAPDNLQKGYETQVWLAQSNEEKVKVSGSYFFHQQERPHHPDSGKSGLQEELLDLCKGMTGISFK